MKIKVQTKGGSYDFDCGPEETLLYAGLRNGLSLPYECATGTCGTCRARVVEGKTHLEWADAPGMSYVKQEKKEILMCQARARGDCTLRVPGKMTGEIKRDRWPSYFDGQVNNCRLVTHDVSLFDVKLDKPTSFDAGQFVLLESDEVVGTRAYSMVNYDRETNKLVFVIKRKHDGKFSDWIFDNNVEGKSIKIFGPLGCATFHPKENKNILCIAGGSGIAGMMAIVSHGCQSSYFKTHNGFIFFGVRSKKDIFFLEELSNYVMKYPENLEVTIALSEETNATGLQKCYQNLRFATGFVHAVVSEHMTDKYLDMLAYVAGPPPMVDSALRMLVLEAKFPGTDIRYDKFT